MDTTHNHPLKRMFFQVCSLLVISGLFLSACGVPAPASTKPVSPVEVTASTPKPLPTESPPPSLREAAENIAAEIGMVVDVIEGDPERVVYIFEERHNSILDQIEIAIMFNRLYTEQGMRHIGLEGLTTAEGIMDLSWARTDPPYQPDQSITSREDVLVQMAQDGILNNAELIGLIYNDVQVHGIDDADLYAVTLENPNIWYAPYDLNYQLAIMMMTPEQFEAFKVFLARDQKQEAYNYAMKINGYCREVAEHLKGDLSAEDLIVLLDELAAKAEDQAALKNIELNKDLLAAMAELRAYMDVVVARSEAMAAAALALLEANPGTPLGMTVGNMHGDRIVQIFAEAGISVAWVHPLALAEGDQAGTMSADAYYRYEQGLSPSPDSTLGAFLDDRRKPRGLGDKTTTTEEGQLRQALQDLMKLALDWEKQHHRYPTDLEFNFLVKVFVEKWNQKQNIAASDTSSPLKKIYFDPNNLPTIGLRENASGWDDVLIFFTLLSEGDEIEVAQLKGVLSLKKGIAGKDQKTIGERLEDARNQLKTPLPETPAETELGSVLEDLGTTQDVCGDTQVTWKTEG